MRTAIVLLLLTAAAYADDNGGNNELTVTSSSRALRTSSANAITGESLSGGELAYGHRLVAFPRLDMWAHAAFGFGVAQGAMFQTLATELDTLALTAGARVRYQLHARFDASARLDVGATRAALAIRDDAGHAAADHGWGAIANVGVGIDTYAFRGQRYALALRIEVGAVATSSIPLTAAPAMHSEDTLALEMTAASLGSLNLSGPSLSVAVVGRF